MTSGGEHYIPRAGPRKKKWKKGKRRPQKDMKRIGREKDKAKVEKRKREKLAEMEDARAFRSEARPRFEGTSKNIRTCSELQDLIRGGGYRKHQKLLDGVVQLFGEEVVDDFLGEQTRFYESFKYLRGQATKAVDELVQHVKPVVRFHKMVKDDVADNVVTKEERDAIREFGHDRIKEAMEHLREHATPLRVLFACRHTDPMDRVRYRIPEAGEEADHEEWQKRLVGQLAFHPGLQEKFTLTDLFEEIMTKEEPTVLERKLKAQMERGIFKYMDDKDREELEALVREWHNKKMGWV